MIKVEKEFSLLNYAFVKKTKNIHLNENIGGKKWRPRFLEYAERHVFRLSKIIVF